MRHTQRKNQLPIQKKHLLVLFTLGFLTLVGVLFFEHSLYQNTTPTVLGVQNGE